VRSIFERFPDMHALRVAVTDHAIAEGRSQGALRDVDSERMTRIRSHVERRGHGCERWLPLWRVLATQNEESPELKKRIRMIRDLVRLRLELTFQPELAGTAEPLRRHTVIALEALTDFENWGRMREFYGLDFEQAATVWVRAIDQLLPPTPLTS
jgi:hypothetical protein